MSLYKNKHDTDHADRPSTSKRQSDLSNSNSDTSTKKVEEDKSKDSIEDTTNLDEVVKVGSVRGRKRRRPAKKQERKERSLKRRKVSKRRPILKALKRRRPRYETSCSSIYTKLSSVSSTSIGCKHCGHRCCRRNTKNSYHYCKEQSKAKKNHLVPKTKISVKIQVGTRCKMLSPLFVSTNEEPSKVTSLDNPKRLYSEVTPEMIYHALNVLGKWREAVSIEDICAYLMRTYPVNPEKEELLQELREKLETASKLDLIEYIGEDKWMLRPSLTVLQKTHVTRFWELHSDTMTPISRNNKTNPENPENEELNASNSNNANINNQEVSDMYI